MLNPDTKEKIFYYKNVIKDPQSIINSIDSCTPDWEFWSTKPSNDEPYKRSSYEFADYKPVNIELINIYIEKCINHYEISNNIKIKKLTEVIASKFYPGKHMGFHSDSSGSKNSPQLTIMVNLNDDYVGGELVFKHQDLTLKPTAGSIVIYPSVEPYSHEPELITEGKKICCIMFGYL